MAKRDYTRFSNNHSTKNETTMTPPVEEVKVEEVQEEVKKPEPRIGVVTNCQLLNVRKEPRPDAEIVCTLENAVTVEIELEKSTEEYYKVYNSAGIEGFCMKKYIEIKE